jgi:hypothetical protein
MRKKISNENEQAFKATKQVKSSQIAAQKA